MKKKKKTLFDELWERDHPDEAKAQQENDLAEQKKKQEEKEKLLLQQKAKAEAAKKKVAVTPAKPAQDSLV